ncbi:MAG: type II/IV secretion system ATPase subunit [Euryarchaeota archaeon]|nr:type II/IV secretion system ATPase subunit [Euryarchaeota archaeon]
MTEMGIEGNMDTLEDNPPPVNPDIPVFHLSLPGMDILITVSIILFIISILGFAFQGQLINVPDADLSGISSLSYIMQILGILLLLVAYFNGKMQRGIQITGKYALYMNTVMEMTKRNFKIRELKEVPVYDASKYGELVSYAHPQDYEEVEQTWVSKPFTLVTIINNLRSHKNMYIVSEPVLNDFEKTLMLRVYESLKIFLLEDDIDFSRMNKEIILYNNFLKILDVYGLDLEPTSLNKIWYYMKRDYAGYGKLDVLLKDPMIEDISCDGADVPVYLYHRKYTNIETNVIFEEEELNNAILKLAQVSGKSISTGYPILNARLPDGSRLEATLGREVTTRGGTITIRKFREEPFTPIDLIKYGTFNTEVMAYLWIAVENHKNIIIVGETAAGKTTVLNAISLFIPSESKVITIEDTRELTLYHKNWIPATIRETFMGQEAADIDMYELLRSALRQRPEFLLVGEIRGKESYTLFQAMSTGHTTFSTMHAGSIQTAVNRLLSEPINVPLMMLSSLDIMIIEVLRHVGKKRVRRTETVSEFVGINAASGDISTREVYKWNPVHDSIEKSGASSVLDSIMHNRGWDKERINKELEDRKALLQYLLDNDINDYRDVTSIIRRYYEDREEIMNLVREGKVLLSEQHGSL